MQQDEEHLEPPVKKRKLAVKDVTGNPQALIGLHLESDWGEEGWFKGVVDKYKASKKRFKWHIVYEDGDDEWGQFVDNYTVMNVNRGARAVRWLDVQPVESAAAVLEPTSSLSSPAKSAGSAPCKQIGRDGNEMRYSGGKGVQVLKRTVGESGSVEWSEAKRPAKDKSERKAEGQTGGRADSQTGVTTPKAKLPDSTAAQRASHADGGPQMQSPIGPAASPQLAPEGGKALSPAVPTPVKVSSPILQGAPPTSRSKPENAPSAGPSVLAAAVRMAGTGDIRKTDVLSQVELARPPSSFKSKTTATVGVLRAKLESRTLLASAAAAKPPSVSPAGAARTDEAAGSSSGQGTVQEPPANGTHSAAADSAAVGVTANGVSVKLETISGLDKLLPLKLEPPAIQPKPVTLVGKPQGRTTIISKSAVQQVAIKQEPTPVKAAPAAQVGMAPKDKAVVPPAKGKPETAGQASSTAASAALARSLFEQVRQLGAAKQAAAKAEGAAGTLGLSGDDLMRRIMANAFAATQQVQAGDAGSAAATLHSSSASGLGVTTIGAASSRVTMKSRSAPAPVEKSKEELEMEAMVDSISGSDKAIKSAAAKAIEAGRKLGPKKIIRLILEKLKARTESGKRVHLLFLVDSIVQKSMNVKDDSENGVSTFPKCVAAALSELVRHTAKDEISLVKVEKVVNVWQRKEIFSQCGASREFERVMEELEDLRQQILPPEMLSATMDASGNRTRMQRVWLPIKSFGPDIIVAYLANQYGSMGKGEGVPGCEKTMHFPVEEFNESDWGSDLIPADGKFITWGDVMQNPALYPRSLTQQAHFSPTRLSPDSQLRQAHANTADAAPADVLATGAAKEGVIPPGLVPDAGLEAAPAALIQPDLAVSREVGNGEAVTLAVDVEDTWTYSEHSPAVFNMPRAPSHGPPTTGRASSGAGSDVEYEEDDFTFPQHGTGTTSPGPIHTSAPYLSNSTSISIPGVGTVQDGNLTNAGQVQLAAPVQPPSLTEIPSSQHANPSLGSQPAPSWQPSLDHSNGSAAPAPATAHSYEMQQGAAASAVTMATASAEAVHPSWNAPASWQSQFSTIQQQGMQQQPGDTNVIAPYHNVSSLPSTSLPPAAATQYSLPQEVVQASPSAWGMEDVADTPVTASQQNLYANTPAPSTFEEHASPAEAQDAWPAQQTWPAQPHMWDSTAGDVLDTWDPHTAPSAQEHAPQVAVNAAATYSTPQAPRAAVYASHDGLQRASRSGEEASWHASHAVASTQLPPGFAVQDNVQMPAADSHAQLLPPHLNQSYGEPSHQAPSLAIAGHTDNTAGGAGDPPLPEEPPPLPDEFVPPLPSEPPPPLDDVPPPLPDYEPPPLPPPDAMPPPPPSNPEPSATPAGPPGFTPQLAPPVTLIPPGFSIEAQTAPTDASTSWPVYTPAAHESYAQEGAYPPGHTYHDQQPANTMETHESYPGYYNPPAYQNHREPAPAYTPLPTAAPSYTNGTPQTYHTPASTYPSANSGYHSQQRHTAYGGRPMDDRSKFRSGPPPGSGGRGRGPGRGRGRGGWSRSEWR